MEIKSCQVENFGVLKGKRFDFSKGLNVIEEKNGRGKTTLSVFIKSMFYGMEYSKKRKELTERERFLPWQGGNCGGKLVFSISGKDYEITRFFGKKKDEDEFELRDLSTGKLSHDYPENIGEEIFGIDEDSFERSIFINLSDKTPAMRDSINAKLGNLIDNTDDINNFESAYERLSELSKSLKPLREGGEEKLIRKIGRELSEAESELRRCAEAEVRCAKLSERIDELSKRREELSVRLEESNRRMREAALREKLLRYRSLKKNLSEDEKEVKRLRETFDGNVPDEKGLGECEKTADSYADIKRKINEIYDIYGSREDIDARLTSIKAEFDKGFPDDEAIHEFEKASKDLREFNIRAEAMRPSESEMDFLKEYEKRDSTIPEQERRAESSLRLKVTLALITAVAAAAAGAFVIFSRSSDPFGRGLPVYVASFFCVGLLCLFWGISLRGSKRALRNMRRERLHKLRDLEVKYEALLQKREAYEEYMRKNASLIEGSRKILSDFRERYAGGLGKAEDERLSESILKCRERFEELKEAKAETKSLERAGKELLEKTVRFFNEHGRRAEGDDVFAVISGMKKDAAVLERKMKDEEESRRELMEFSEENDISFLEGLKESELQSPGEEDPAKEYEALSAERERISQQLRDGRKDLRELSELADMRPELEREIAELSEKSEHLNKKYELITKTMEFLKEAKDRLSTSYMHDMREAFYKYLAITDDGELRFMLDNDLKVEVEGGGKNRRSEYLSRGYRDLVNICTRFALIDVMYKDEKPFIILDDPFVNLDRDKLQRALDFVRKISQERQIIYFCCHPARIPEEITAKEL